MLTRTLLTFCCLVRALTSSPCLRRERNRETPAPPAASSCSASLRAETRCRVPRRRRRLIVAFRSTRRAKEHNSQFCLESVRRLCLASVPGQWRHRVVDAQRLTRPARQVMVQRLPKLNHGPHCLLWAKGTARHVSFLGGSVDEDHARPYNYTIDAHTVHTRSKSNSETHNHAPRSVHCRGTYTHGQRPNKSEA